MAKQSIHSYMEDCKKQKLVWSRRRILWFVMVIFGFGLIGLLFFARPKKSLVEKRKLADFPALTASGIWDGTWFGDLTAWYADTYPLREGMIRLQSKTESFYGIRTTAIYGDGEAKGDEIPVAVSGSESLTEAPVLTMSESDKQPEEEKREDGTLHAKPEVAGTVYVTDKRGFELYYFNQAGVDLYCSMINTVASKVGSDAAVYDIIVPNSFGVNMDEKIQESMNAGNQGETCRYAYSRMSDSVRPVSVYEELRAHNSEYLYFQTDHHWTGLGAYYTYREWCRAKGITPHELDYFEKREYPDFLGSFYAYSNQSPELASNPDTVVAYVPKGTNDEKTTLADGTVLDMNIIQDGSQMSEENKYLTFLGGDAPLIEIRNPGITDGTTCVIIKESYGNAFVPFLVDHYENVYVIDYRYYEKNVMDIIKAHKKTDLIFLNNTEALGEAQTRMMLGLFQ